ncbi:MAG: ABC transporter permease, partial [Acidobacteriaceae bacterium]|nr:ABC transporter permease [Acidobacteriaceae bacterium]
MNWPRIFRRSSRGQELARDLQIHLDLETDEHRALGLSESKAQVRARRKLGNPTLVREDVYHMYSYPFIETLWQDVRYAGRLMRQKPIFAAMVSLTLAVGIGGNAAVFSIVDAVLLQQLPYKEPSQLVAIWDKHVRDSGVSKMFDSFADFRNLAEHAKAFNSVAAATWAVNWKLLSGYGSTREVFAIPVSESFFSLLGIPPARGRTFLPEDQKGGCSIVLSDRLWRGALGGDPHLVGGNVQLDDQVCAVLGVMPPSFAFYPEAASLWALITPNFSPPADRLPVGIFARLKPGVSLTQAQAEITRLHAALHEHDSKERDLVPIVHILQEEFTFLADAGLRTTVWVLMVAVNLVLLIVCLNVATLMLGQALGRERELAIRAALGGGRRRLARQFLTEGLVFAFFGGTLGIGIAYWAIRSFRIVQPVELPIGAQVEMNGPVVTFLAVVSMTTAILFGLFPSWRASRLAIAESLKSGGRGTLAVRPQKLIQGLITAELALSLVLLTGASLLLGSLLNMNSEPLGFQSDGLVINSVTLPASHYSAAPRRLMFYERLVTRLGDKSALSTALPPYGVASSVLHVEGKSTSPQTERHDVEQRTITPGYFKVLGVQLLQGRFFDLHDQMTSEPVAVINKAAAREYFTGTDPIGRRIRVDDPSEQNPWRTIVGIVGTEKSARNYHQVGWAERATVYKPLAQDPP